MLARALLVTVHCLFYGVNIHRKSKFDWQSHQNRTPNGQQNAKTIVFNGIMTADKRVSGMF